MSAVSAMGPGVPEETEVEAEVVFAYRRTGKFAFHVLAGSLESDPAVAHVPVRFANGVEAVVEAVAAARARRRRVLVCWSFYSPDFSRMRAELADVLATCGDPDVVHIAGGVHASAEPESTLRAGWDLVGRGEGEFLIRELVASWNRGDDLREVAGVAWLDPEGRLAGSRREDQVALDDFPPFAPGHRRHGPIEITRGCIYACRFCQTPYFSKARFRHRSLDNTFHWLRYLRGIGFRDYRFLSPTSLSYGSDGPEPDLAAVEALLAGAREIIGADKNLFYGTFPSELRPEHVTPEVLALLSRYVDNRTLILGGQSGSERVLERSARGHGVEAIERAAALCLEAGFRPHVDFIFGLPGERREDVAQTLALARRLAERGVRVHGHTFMPLPGTPFRGEAPGRLEASTRTELLRLASQGRLYGQWQQQVQTARELAGDRLRAESSRVGSKGAQVPLDPPPTQG